MSCVDCIRWRRHAPPIRRPRSWFTRYGRCLAPAAQKPYWMELRFPLNGEEVAPTYSPMLHETHGQACPAFKAKRKR